MKAVISIANQKGGLGENHDGRLGCRRPRAS